jgi:hypothetical protein
MTPDEERLRRYLDWQRARDAERAQRRRRVLGYVAAPALCVVALGSAVWLAWPWIDPAPSVTTNTMPESRARAIESPPPAPESEAREANAPEPPTRPRPRGAPRVASQARVRAEPTPTARAIRDELIAVPAPGPSSEAPTESEVAAAVAPAPVAEPTSPASETPREVPQREGSEDLARETALAPLPPSDVVALPSQPKTVRERVNRWAKGEVQELRDGVKRELRGFRSGYEKVRDFFRR